MGYDMNLVKADETYADDLAQARADFDAAVAKRRPLPENTPEYEAAQAEVEDAYDRIGRFNTGYFRLNIWGMQRMHNHMVELGMAAFEYSPPGWPDPEDFGLTNEQLWDLDDEERTNHPDENVRKYHEASEQHKRWSPPDEPGLPLHKFGSNDGWVVTPLDCMGALKAYEKAQQENPDLVAKIREEWKQEDGTSYFDEWIAYLHRAIQHDGFEVW